MHMLTHMFLPTHEKKVIFWKMRRNGSPHITIANLVGISRQAVSRALLLMDGKIESALREMARATRIEVEKINPERGVLIGRPVPFQAAALIFVSEKHGIQGWYRTRRKLRDLPALHRMHRLYRDYAIELGIRIQEAGDPTKMAGELFAKVKAMT